MSTSIKFISPSDPDASVFITHKAGKRHTKVYANGTLVRQFKRASEYQNGVDLEVNGFGNIRLSLDPLHRLQISVDGVSFEKEINKKEAIRSFQGAVAVFVILASLNFLFLLGAIVLIVDAPRGQNGTGIMLTSLALVCTTFYTLAAIYLRKGVTVFYFIGIVLFLVITLYFSRTYMDHDHEFFLWYTLPRLIFLAVLLRYLNRILQFSQKYQEKDHSDILDSDD